MSRKEPEGRISQTRRRCVFVAALIIPFAGFLFFLATRAPRQPIYRSKPLADWLQTYAPSSPFTRSAPQWKETDEAVRQMGTNCFPVLLRMIRARDSNLKGQIVALAQKQHFVKLRFTRAADENIEASRAFIVLGDAAKDAVPELVRAYDEDVSVQSRRAILDALSWIGASAEPAIPLLLRATTNSDPQLRANALWALGEIHAKPSSCVPRLIDALGDSNSWPRLSAAHALGAFGGDARAAIPALTSLANQPLQSAFIGSQVQVMLEARKALERIGPEVDELSEFNLPTLDSPIAPR